MPSWGNSLSRVVLQSFCLRALLLACLSLLIGVTAVRAQVYKWTDRHGKVHFTDNLEAVPPEERSQVEEKASTPPSSASPRVKTIPVPVSYTVPLHRVGNALFVDVVFNDDVKVRMLVDTGATHTLISPSVAQQLRWDARHADIVPLMTANGVTLVSATQVSSMSVGGATAYNVDVIVHDAGPPGGLLGMSFLDNFQASIDATAGKMVLTPFTTSQGALSAPAHAEQWWRSRFRFYRQTITNIATQLQEKKLTPALKTRLEKSGEFFQQKLDALDRQATFAAIPREWRY